MELGLSLGDTKSRKFNCFIPKASDRFTAGATTGAAASTAAGSSGLGFCMALGIIPSNETTHHHGDDAEGQQNLKKNERKRQILIDSSRKVSSLKAPLQLDLLPLIPLLPQTPLPWSSENGSSEGGSSENTPAGRGLDVQAVAGTEEATSSFRQDFRTRGNSIVGGKKREFEMENDTVEVEIGSSRASDEDDNGVSRKKLRLSKEQSAYLEESFKEHNTLNPKQKLALAKRLNLRPRQVEVWFQNRRARTKLKQTEVDYEYLKKYRETLSEENKRLQKELQQLRSLNPFYVQLPATTLTMCASCERVATTAPPPSAASTTAVEQDFSKLTTPFPLSSKPNSFYPFAHTPPCNNSS